MKDTISDPTDKLDIRLGQPFGHQYRLDRNFVYGSAALRNRASGFLLQSDLLYHTWEHPWLALFKDITRNTFPVSIWWFSFPAIYAYVFLLVLDVISKFYQVPWDRPPALSHFVGCERMCVSSMPKVMWPLPVLEMFPSPLHRLPIKMTDRSLIASLSRCRPI